MIRPRQWGGASPSRGIEMRIAVIAVPGVSRQAMSMIDGGVTTGLN